MIVVLNKAVIYFHKNYYLIVQDKIHQLSITRTQGLQLFPSFNFGSYSNFISDGSIIFVKITHFLIKIVVFLFFQKVIIFSNI
jgi:hypothetical protein